MKNNPAFPLAVKAVMFDLDGTLIDSAPDLAAAADRMLHDLGRAQWDLERYRHWVGNGMVRFVKRALTGETQGEPEIDLYERALALFRRYYGESVSALSRLYPGARETLEHLQAEGFALACVTNKAGVFAHPLLADLGVDGYFGIVVAGDTVSALKPDPAPLLHACGHFGAAPETALFVGDSMNDVQAARAAGMPVICVSYGYRQGRAANELAADGVVDSLAELPQYLRLQR